MTSTTDPQLVTAAQAARLLGITRQRVLELAASGPDVPADHGHPPQVWDVLNLASSEAQALNHPWIGPDHLGLAMLHPDCPGAARAVLESFGARLERLRQAFVDSMGDPYDTPVTHRKVPPATQLALERANLEAAWLADAEVTSEHVLLALTGRWHDSCFVLGWLARSGIPADAVRQRLVDATEGVVLPEPLAQLGPPPAPPLPPSSWDTLQLAPNPLGHDPRRRGPWGSRGSKSRWTRRPSREAGPGSTSSTATATPYSPSTAGRCTSLWTRTPSRCWTSMDGKCSARSR